MQVVTVVVLDLRLCAEFELILAHRFELLLVVVEDVVSPGFSLAQ